MTSTAFQILEQATWIVRSGARRGVAVWTAYALATSRHTDVVLLVPERTLLPRDRIAHGIRASAQGLERDEVVEWLGGQGYEVIGEQRAPQ